MASTGRPRRRAGECRVPCPVVQGQRAWDGSWRHPIGGGRAGEGPSPFLAAGCRQAWGLGPRQEQNPSIATAASHAEAGSRARLAVLRASACDSASDLSPDRSYVSLFPFSTAAGAVAWVGTADSARRGGNFTSGGQPKRNCGSARAGCRQKPAGFAEWPSVGPARRRLPGGSRPGAASTQF